MMDDKNMKKNPLHMVTFILLAIGGLNWLLVAFGYNVVDAIFGMGSGIAKVVYIVIGVSAIYELAMHKQNCRMCNMMMHDKGSSPAAMGGGSMGGGKM